MVRRSFSSVTRKVSHRRPHLSERRRARSAGMHSPKRRAIGQSGGVSGEAFRFGYQLGSGDADQLLANARAAEDAGFDVIPPFDPVGELWPPLAPLAAIASATDRIRLCPLVINNDFHHPVH